MKRHAFTLAETLITLGIIGVVAALTIPNLISHYQEQVTVNKLLKSYSILEQAFTSAINENGPVDTWCSQEDLWNACSIKIYETINPYLNVVKECDKGSENGCFNRSYKHRFKDATASVNSRSVVLSDGMSISFNANTGGSVKNLWCKGSKTAGKAAGYCGAISVDVDGLKGKNTVDVDLFGFYLFKDGIAPRGMPKEDTWTESFDDQCLGKGYYSGSACSGWIIINKNMDYLHCPDKLGWNKAKSCKE